MVFGLLTVFLLSALKTSLADHIAKCYKEKDCEGGDAVRARRDQYCPYGKKATVDQFLPQSYTKNIEFTSDNEIALDLGKSKGMLFSYNKTFGKKGKRAESGIGTGWVEGILNSNDSVVVANSHGSGLSTSTIERRTLDIYNVTKFRSRYYVACKQVFDFDTTGSAFSQKYNQDSCPINGTGYVFALYDSSKCYNEFCLPLKTDDTSTDKATDAGTKNQFYKICSDINNASTGVPQRFPEYNSGGKALYGKVDELTIIRSIFNDNVNLYSTVSGYKDKLSATQKAYYPSLARYVKCMNERGSANMSHRSDADFGNGGFSAYLNDVRSFFLADREGKDYGPGTYFCVYDVTNYALLLAASTKASIKTMCYNMEYNPSDSVVRVGCIKGRAATGPNIFPRVLTADQNIKTGNLFNNLLKPKSSVVKFIDKGDVTFIDNPEVVRRVSIPDADRLKAYAMPGMSGALLMPPQVGEKCRGTFFAPKMMVKYGSHYRLLHFDAGLGDYKKLYGDTDKSAFNGKFVDGKMYPWKLGYKTSADVTVRVGDDYCSISVPTYIADDNSELKDHLSPQTTYSKAIDKFASNEFNICRDKDDLTNDCICTRIEEDRFVAYRIKGADFATCDTITADKLEKIGSVERPPLPYVINYFNNEVNSQSNNVFRIKKSGIYVSYDQPSLKLSFTPYGHTSSITAGFAVAAYPMVVPPATSLNIVNTLEYRVEEDVSSTTTATDDNRCKYAYNQKFCANREDCSLLKEISSDVMKTDKMSGICGATVDTKDKVTQDKLTKCMDDPFDSTCQDKLTKECVIYNTLYDKCIAKTKCPPLSGQYDGETKPTIVDSLTKCGIEKNKNVNYDPKLNGSIKTAVAAVAATENNAAIAATTAEEESLKFYRLNRQWRDFVCIENAIDSSVENATFPQLAAIQISNFSTNNYSGWIKANYGAESYQNPDYREYTVAKVRDFTLKITDYDSGVIRESIRTPAAGQTKATPDLYRTDNIWWTRELKNIFAEYVSNQETWVKGCGGATATTTDTSSTSNSSQAIAQCVWGKTEDLRKKIADEVFKSDSRIVIDNFPECFVEFATGSAYSMTKILADSDNKTKIKTCIVNNIEIRRRSSWEMNACIEAPPRPGWSVKEENRMDGKDVEIYIPRKCNIVDIRMWGAGSSGTGVVTPDTVWATHGWGNSHPDYGMLRTSGASGGYIKTVIDVNKVKQQNLLQYRSFKVNPGQGGGKGKTDMQTISGESTECVTAKGSYAGGSSNFTFKRSDKVDAGDASKVGITIGGGNAANGGSIQSCSDHVDVFSKNTIISKIIEGAGYTNSLDPCRITAGGNSFIGNMTESSYIPTGNATKYAYYKISEGRRGELAEVQYKFVNDGFPGCYNRNNDRKSQCGGSDNTCKVVYDNDLAVIPPDGVLYNNEISCKDLGDSVGDDNKEMISNNTTGSGGCVYNARGCTSADYNGGDCHNTNNRVMAGGDGKVEILSSKVGGDFRINGKIDQEMVDDKLVKLGTDAKVGDEVSCGENDWCPLEDAILNGHCRAKCPRVNVKLAVEKIANSGVYEYWICEYGESMEDWFETDGDSSVVQPVRCIKSSPGDGDSNNEDGKIFFASLETSAIARCEHYGKDRSRFFIWSNIWGQTPGNMAERLFGGTSGTMTDDVDSQDLCFSVSGMTVTKTEANGYNKTRKVFTANIETGGNDLSPYVSAAFVGNSALTQTPDAKSYNFPKTMEARSSIPIQPDVYEAPVVYDMASSGVAISTNKLALRCDSLGRWTLQGGDQKTAKEETGTYIATTDYKNTLPEAQYKCPRIDPELASGAYGVEYTGNAIWPEAYVGDTAWLVYDPKNEGSVAGAVINDTLRDGSVEKRSGAPKCANGFMLPYSRYLDDVSCADRASCTQDDTIKEKFAFSGIYRKCEKGGIWGRIMMDGKQIRKYFKKSATDTTALSTITTTPEAVRTFTNNKSFFDVIRSFSSVDDPDAYLADYACKPYCRPATLSRDMNGNDLIDDLGKKYKIEVGSDGAYSGQLEIIKNNNDFKTICQGIESPVAVPDFNNPPQVECYYDPRYNASYWRLAAGKCITGCAPVNTGFGDWPEAGLCVKTVGDHYEIPPYNDSFTTAVCERQDEFKPIKSIEQCKLGYTKNYSNGTAANPQRVCIGGVYKPLKTQDEKDAITTYETWNATQTNQNLHIYYDKLLKYSCRPTDICAARTLTSGGRDESNTVAQGAALPGNGGQPSGECDISGDDSNDVCIRVYVSTLPYGYEGDLVCRSQYRNHTGNGQATRTVSGRVVFACMFNNSTGQADWTRIDNSGYTSHGGAAMNNAYGTGRGSTKICKDRDFLVANHEAGIFIDSANYYSSGRNDGFAEQDRVLITRAVLPVAPDPRKGNCLASTDADLAADMKAKLKAAHLSIDNAASDTSIITFNNNMVQGQVTRGILRCDSEGGTYIPDPNDIPSIQCVGSGYDKKWSVKGKCIEGCPGIYTKGSTTDSNATDNDNLDANAIFPPTPLGVDETKGESRTDAISNPAAYKASKITNTETLKPYTTGKCNTGFIKTDGYAHDKAIEAICVKIPNPVDQTGKPVPPTYRMFVLRDQPYKSGKCYKNDAVEARSCPKVSFRCNLRDKDGGCRDSDSLNDDVTFYTGDDNRAHGIGNGVKLIMQNSAGGAGIAKACKVAKNFGFSITCYDGEWKVNGTGLSNIQEYKQKGSDDKFSSKNVTISFDGRGECNQYQGYDNDRSNKNLDCEGSSKINGMCRLW